MITSFLVACVGIRILLITCSLASRKTWSGCFPVSAQPDSVHGQLGTDFGISIYRPYNTPGPGTSPCSVNARGSNVGVCGKSKFTAKVDHASAKREQQAVKQLFSTAPVSKPAQLSEQHCTQTNSQSRILLWISPSDQTLPTNRRLKRIAQHTTLSSTDRRQSMTFLHSAGNMCDGIQTVQGVPGFGNPLP